MIWKTAWKNVWRNRVRSLVVISSVTVGIFGGVFAIALMNGMIVQRLSNALNEEVSHIQINARDFRINNDPVLIMRNGEDILKQLTAWPGVQAVAGRKVLNGMAQTASRADGVQINGINPGEEKKVFNLDQKIIRGTGTYFENENNVPQVYIGEELAKDLKLIKYRIDTSFLANLGNKVPRDVLERLRPLTGLRFPDEKLFSKKVKSVLTGRETKKYGPAIRESAWNFSKDSRLVLTFLDKDNNQVSSIFRICGIYNIPNTSFEKTNVFVRNSDLSKLSAFPDSSYHLLIVKLNDMEQADKIAAEFAKMFPDLEVQSWKKLSPELALMTDIVQQFYFIFGIIILAALAFGIINTMLMVVLERTRELGMLTAVGMNRRKVFSMIMLESVFLSLTGGITGMIAGYIVIAITAKTGINLSQYAEGLEAVGYSAIIYPSITPGFFIVVTLLVIITGMASSIYPAMKALRLNPVEAIRTE